MRFALLALAATWALILHMLLLGAAPPVERRLTLHAAARPAHAPPMRIALLSDLHVATPGDSATHLSHVVARVNAARPDLVLIAGDFLSTGTNFARPATIPEAVAPLAALHAPLGTVAVLGNHDYGDRAALASALRGAGVDLLENQAARRGPVIIAGFGDMLTGHAAPIATEEAARTLGGIPIALSHSPDIVPLLRYPTALVLAGHTHCGQIAPWPFGPIFTASHYGRRYACGLVREPGRLTLVTAGLGTSNLPMRLGAPPDYWIIDIGW